MRITQSADQASATASIALSGRLDVLETPALTEAVLEAIAGGARSLNVDLSELTFIDSAGLAVLVRARRDIRALGGEIVLTRPRGEDAMRVFYLTRFDQIFTMVEPGSSPPAPAPPDPQTEAER